MSTADKSITAVHQLTNLQSIKQKLALVIGLSGIFILTLAFLNVHFPNKEAWLAASLLAIIAGIILYANELYLHQPAGIKNNCLWYKSLTSKGVLGWSLGIILTMFYVIIYWYPQYLGFNGDKGNTGLIAFFDPLSKLLNGHDATQWFVYGTLYTIAILSLGYKFILKYRHNKYQIVRTISVMFFQLAFAFLIPEILSKLNPDKAYFVKDVKNMWPLNYYLFEDWHLKNLVDGGNLGMFMLLLGIFMIFIGSPILTYFFGKRWYCSWVCGCGGLAETAGDPFRHLSNKSVKAWKFERWSIHLILVFIFITTVSVIYSFLSNNSGYSIITKGQFAYGVAILIIVLIGLLYFFRRRNMDKDAVYTIGSLGTVLLLVFLLNHFSGRQEVFFLDSYKLRSWYGFFIGAAFSGVIGVGFYPLLGSRVWCRFGCPMAAILGLQQRLFSRFRITTNGGQCISCGNCSNACEMGIDVRSYAQKGENIVRASCVGCGICSAVCPRGVLKLENGNEEGRINSNAVMTGGNVNLIEILKFPKHG